MSATKSCSNCTCDDIWISKFSNRTRLRNCRTHCVRVRYVRYVASVYVLYEVHACILFLCILYYTIHKYVSLGSSTCWRAERPAGDRQSVPIETRCTVRQPAQWLLHVPPRFTFCPHGAFISSTDLRSC
jgi:hypothetical protein